MLRQGSNKALSWKAVSIKDNCHETQGQDEIKIHDYPVQPDLNIVGTIYCVEEKVGEKCVGFWERQRGWFGLCETQRQ